MNEIESKMIQLLLLSSTFAVALAQRPAWFDGPCGVSKYPDAGNMDLPALTSIVGGIEAREHEFPWMVSIRYKATNSHFCGGSVINDRWILTASHCMSGERESDVSVVVGDHKRNDDTNSYRQHHDVELIIMHPNYHPIRLTNDISLIKLTQPISFNENVQPVCEPEQSDNYHYRKSLTSGWGRLESGGVCCPQTLRYVTLNVTTNEFCAEAYSTTIYKVYEDMVCASDNVGSTERDSCQSDSGGPLVAQEADGSFSLVGIVSWGEGCASGYPGVYSRVTHFHDWILESISSN